MEMSQPETELAGDDAAMELLMSRSEQAAEPEDEAEQAEPEVEEPEEAEAEEAPEEDDDPEIDLGEIKLRKSELKAGYMKDADYRRKTAEAAEVKREAQAVQERAQQERSHYVNRLDVLIDGLQTQLIGSQQELARLAQEDPAAWVAENAKVQQRYADYQRAIHERQALGQRQQADSEAQLAEYAKEQRQLLDEKLPSWRDPKVRDKEVLEVAKTLIARGYSEDEINMLQDHRALLIALDAAKWQEHVKSLASAKAKKAAPVPVKAVQPGARTNPSATNPRVEDLRRKAAKTRSTQDILAYMTSKDS